MQTNWRRSQYLWREVPPSADLSPFGFYSIISRVVRWTPGNRSNPRVRLRFASRTPRIASVGHRVAVTYEDAKKVGPYADALRLVGLEPVLLTADEPCSLKGLDGLLITGGCDIDPKRYGQERGPETQEPNPAPDCMEIGRLGEALEKLGGDLRISAQSVKDGIVEGVERLDKEFAVGVQWHPEDQVRADETQFKLFRAFAEAVGSHGKQAAG